MYMYSFLSCIARNKQVLIHLCIAITNHLWHRNYHCSLKNVSMVMTGSSPAVSSTGRQPGACELSSMLPAQPLYFMHAHAHGCGAGRLFAGQHQRCLNARTARAQKRTRYIEPTASAIPCFTGVCRRPRGQRWATQRLSQQSPRCTNGPVARARHNHESMLSLPATFPQAAHGRTAIGQPAAMSGPSPGRAHRQPACPA